MVDTPISLLPAAPQANDTDEWEANQSGTSRRVSRLQTLAGTAPLVHTHTQAQITDAGALAALDSVSATEIDADAVGESELDTPTTATLEAFQNNLGEVEETGTFAISATTHFKREVKLQTTGAAVTVQLPAPNDAQFAAIDEGHFCDLRVVSGANEAQVTALTTDTFRHASGYSAAIAQGDEDSIFLGFSRTTAFGQVYRLHRLDDIWVLYGPYRIIETDNLTLDFAVEDSAVQQLAHCNRLDFGTNLATSVMGRTITVNAVVSIAAPTDINGRTLIDADDDKQFRCTGTGTVTIDGALATGVTVLLINRAGGAVLIAGSGVTITGDASFADGHFATIVKDTASTAVVRATG